MRTRGLLPGLLLLALTACAGAPPGMLAADVSPSPVTSLPEEAILLLTPGHGSRLVGKVHIEGVADSTFEQTLVAQVVVLAQDLFEVIAQEPVVIQAELGQRGPFAADLEFSLPTPGEVPGEIRIFSVSPRDGATVHMTTAQVTLASSGPQEIRRDPSTQERILIRLPEPGARVEGDRVRVEGVGLATFEQTLVAEAFDGDGRLVGTAPILLAAPDLGQHGPFEVEIAIAVASPGPGRIVVRDPSPAFGQTVHLASVDVVFGP